MPHMTCNAQGCDHEGHDCYDYYGLPAGRYCQQHESLAPGQWAYNGEDELSHYEMYGEDD